MPTYQITAKKNCPGGGFALRQQAYLNILFYAATGIVFQMPVFSVVFHMTSKVRESLLWTTRKETVQDGQARISSLVPEPSLSTRWKIKWAMIIAVINISYITSRGGRYSTYSCKYSMIFSTFLQNQIKSISLSSATWRVVAKSPEPKAHVTKVRTSRIELEFRNVGF